MKKKLFSILFALVLVLSFSLVTALPAVAEEPATLLSSTGAIGTPNEDRIVVDVPPNTTLGDIESIAWSEYLIEGYPPHVDIILDLGGEITDALVFEYAYNSMDHYAENGGLMPYGAITGEWFQTFSDDVAGPSAVTDTSFAWLSSGSSGPPTYISGTLAAWKAGGIEGGLGIDSTTSVLRLEIEVDNWVMDKVALVDNIQVAINGSVPITVNILEEDIVGITVTPSNIDFGDVELGEATSPPVDIFVTNASTTAVVDVTASLADAGTVFDHLVYNPSPVLEDIPVGMTESFSVLLDVPSDYASTGLETNTIIFTVTPQ